jgi:hypothetical protein
MPEFVTRHFPTSAAASALAAALLLAVAFGLAACFSPNLGETPFTCGEEAACPEGYQCVPGEGICRQGSATPTIPKGREGGQPLDLKPSGGCDDASLEPNDDPTSATKINVPADYVGFQINPDSDVDWYDFELAANKVVSVDVIFTNASGDLDIAIFNPQMKMLAVSSSTHDNEHVDFTTRESGHYFLLVIGYQGATNCYDYRIGVK